MRVIDGTKAPVLIDLLIRPTTGTMRFRVSCQQRGKVKRSGIKAAGHNRCRCRATRECEFCRTILVDHTLRFAYVQRRTCKISIQIFSAYLNTLEELERNRRTRLFAIYVEFILVLIFNVYLNVFEICISKRLCLKNDLLTLINWLTNDFTCEVYEVCINLL